MLSALGIRSTFHVRPSVKTPECRHATLSPFLIRKAPSHSNPSSAPSPSRHLHLAQSSSDASNSSLAIDQSGESRASKFMATMKEASYTSEQDIDVTWDQIEAKIKVDVAAANTTCVSPDSGLIPEASLWTACIADMVHHLNSPDLASWEGPQTARAARLAHCHSHPAAPVGEGEDSEASEAEAETACNALNPLIHFAQALESFGRSPSDGGAGLLQEVTVTKEVGQLVAVLGRLLGGLQYRKEAQVDGWIATSFLPLHYLLATFTASLELEDRLAMGLPVQYLPTPWVMSHLWLISNFDNEEGEEGDNLGDAGADAGGDADASGYNRTASNFERSQSNAGTSASSASSVVSPSSSSSVTSFSSTYLAWAHMAEVVRWRASVADDKRQARNGKSSAPGTRLGPSVFGVVSDMDNARDEWIDALGEFLQAVGQRVPNNRWTSEADRVQVFTALSNLMEMVSALNDLFLAQHANIPIPQLFACLKSLGRMCQDMPPPPADGQGEEVEEGGEWEWVVEEMRYQWLWQYRHGVLRPEVGAKLTAAMGSMLAEGVLEEGTEIHAELLKRGLVERM
eukprot:gene7443-583_t